MDDLQFIKEKAQQEPVSLPDSLSRDAIEKAIQAKKIKPKKRKKGRILAFTVPAAAALFLVLALIVVPHIQLVERYIPKGDFHAANPQTLGFESYESIADQLEEIKTAYEKDRKDNTHYRLEFSGVKYAATADAPGSVDEADSAVQNSVAPAASENSGGYQNPTGAGTDDSDTVQVSLVFDDAENAEPSEEADHSGTNLRDKAVDEQDIVKTDGKYIYYLPAGGTTIYIVRAKGGNMTKVSEIRKGETGSKYNRYFSGMFLRGDRLVVTGEEYFETPEGNLDNFTSVNIYDISDRSVPKEIQSYRFKGWASSSRMIGGKLVIVTNTGFNLYSFSKNDRDTFIPCYYCGSDVNYVDPGDIILPENTTPDCFINVYTLNIDAGDQPEPEAVSLMADGAEIYCTESTLYVYCQSWFRQNEYSESDKTEIISFDISGDKARYLAKGTVDGTLDDSFAIDAFGGYLRVAVTVNEYGGAFNRYCRVFVLDADLNVVGSTDKLAENESVRSVRFIGNTAYVVTFLNTDPLFVIDLSDPTSPAVVGEVKLPGFSSYLHPVGEGLLMGVGSGGTETGLDGSAKLSLFDVRDPEDPKEIGNLIFKESYFNTDYKAFVDMKDGSYLVPITEYANDYNDFAVSLLRIAVKNDALELSTRYLVNENKYNYGDEPRGLFIGDTVYAAAGTETWKYDETEYYDDVTGGYIYTEEDAPSTEPPGEPEYTRTVFIKAYDKESGAQTGMVTLYEGRD